MRQSGSLAGRLVAVTVVFVLAIWLAWPGSEQESPGPIASTAVDEGEPRLAGRMTAAEGTVPIPGESDAPPEPPPSPRRSRLRRLVEDMLAINQVGDANIPVHSELVSLDTVVRQAVDNVARTQVVLDRHLLAFPSQTRLDEEA